MNNPEEYPFFNDADDTDAEICYSTWDQYYNKLDDYEKDVKDLADAVSSVRQCLQNLEFIEE